MNNLLDKSSDISQRQFAWFRIIFGIYLTWHFAALFPYAGELFSQDGILNTPSLNPFYDKWPNLFFVWGSPLFIQSSLALGVLASQLFTWGKFRRSTALFLWFLHASLFTANPLTANPSLGYVGMLLLLCAATPKQFKKLPGWIPWSAWILLATGYTFSGILKLGSPSWMDGSALSHLMENPLARPGVARNLLISLPEPLLKIMTWSVLTLEVFFLPLAFSKRLRPCVWAAMVSMHIGIIATVDFTDLSLGMLMVHLFTFNPAWVTRATIIWNKRSRVIQELSNRSKNIQLTHGCLLLVLVACLTSACSHQSPHRGIFPFSMMEKPPSKRSAQRHHLQKPIQKMDPVVHYRPSSDQDKFLRVTSKLQAGDVIAFYMSHSEARAYLKKGVIQKIPYELFRFGHVSIVVPDPDQPLTQQNVTTHKLLQVAMKQAVTANDPLEYLRTKSWIAYRPPAGSINPIRLQAFCREATSKGNQADKAYDFRATVGLGNGKLSPQSPEEVRSSYTCATLVVAALGYSGFDLHAVKRKGSLDILTPRQVTDAWGFAR